MSCKNSTVVLDVDGILLSYIPAFIKWTRDVHGWEINPDHPHDSYDMSSWYKGGMTSSEFIELIKEYNSYPRAIPPVEGSLTAVKHLKGLGYTMSVVTSFGGNVGSSEFRKAYLNMLFPDCFEEIHVLGLGDCKKDKLTEIKPKFFIDDCDTYLDSGLSLGITCIGLRTTYNGDTDAIYVDSWDGITYVLCACLNNNFRGV
jgi:hypothetical protein